MIRRFLALAPLSLALACLSGTGCNSASASASGNSRAGNNVSSSGAVQQSAPTGNGKRFGTRDTRDCAVTVDSPSAAQLTQAFICGAENVVVSASYGDSIDLVSNVNLQFSKARSFNQLTDSIQSIDVTQPVYDVRGSQVHHQCWLWTADPNPRLPQPGKNCYKFTAVPEKGIAWRDTFGSWHVSICCAVQRDSDYYPPPTDL